MNAQKSIQDLRIECDSLSCPKKYVRVYLKMAEDLGRPFDKRLAYLDIAEEIASQLTDNYKMITIYAMRGRVSKDAGDYSKALQSYGEGIKYVHNKTDKNWRLQDAWFYSNYGNLLYGVELYRDAIDIYKSCENLMNVNEDLYGEAVAKNNLALCYLKLNQPDSAEIYFNEAYTLRVEIDDSFLLCHSLLYIARVNRILGNMEKADSALEQAIFYSNISDRNDFAGDIYCEWAELASNQSNWEDMSRYLNIAKGMDNPFKDMRWLDLKVGLFKATGPLDSLIYYLDTARANAHYFTNTELERTYLIQKEKLLRTDGQLEQANIYLSLINDLSSELIESSSDIQLELLKIQRDFNKNSNRLKNLEVDNKEKEKTIAYQELILVLVTIITLVILVGFIISFRLNSSIRRVSKKLKILGERTRIASNQMTTAVFTLDYKGRVIFMNNACRKHFRFFDGSNIQETGFFLEQLKNDKFKSEWEEMLQKISIKSNFQNTSSKSIAGRTYFHLTSLSEIRSDGRFEGFVAVITDITSSHEQSIALSKKTQALEIANTAKDRVLSLLAHDLKEGVVSSLELSRLSLHEDTKPEERKAHMQMIFDSLGRTKTLLFKTLDWVQQQSNGLKIQNKPFYIGRLVNDLAKELEIQLKQKEIHFKNSIDYDLEVYGDPNAIRVVLRNLSSNAIKFVQPKTGQIEICALKDDLDGIAIKVKDNGAGIQAEKISDLMEGVALESSIGTKGEEGTGLGLQLCRDLLYKMGSSLKVESSENQGSVFYFSIDSKEEE